MHMARRSVRHTDADDNDAFIDLHTPPGTKRSYTTTQTQWARYAHERGEPILPVKSEPLMTYMRKLIKDGKARSTITKTVPSAIASLHRMHGLDSPTWEPKFKLMKRMIVRATPPRKKNPVTPLILVQLAMQVQPDSFIDVRDMFLFMLLFKVMARQSEAINLRCTDIDVLDVDGKQTAGGSRTACGSTSMTRCKQGCRCPAPCPSEIKYCSEPFLLTYRE